MTRAFIAAEIGKRCQESLGRAIERLRALQLPVRWVRPDLLHVTLKFLGDVSPASIPAVSGVMRAAVQGVEPFDIALKGLEGFPGGSRPRVIFACAENPGGEFVKIHDAIDRGLAEQVGIEEDDRPYTAHVTIGRAARKPVRADPAEMQARLSSADFGTVQIRSIVLMSSTLTPKGPVYAVMDTIPFRPDGVA